MKIYKVSDSVELHETIRSLECYDFIKVYTLMDIDISIYPDCYHTHLKPYGCEIIVEVWSTGFLQYVQYDIDDIGRVYEKPNLVRTYFYYDDICRRYTSYMDYRKPYKDCMRASTGVGHKDGYGNFIAGVYMKHGDYIYNKLSSKIMPEPLEYKSLFLRGATISADSIWVDMVSGTPSIDKMGVKYHENIVHQYFQTKENITSLDNDLSYYDYDYHIVYVKNLCDITDELLYTLNIDMDNYIILEADICRSDWLLEIECVSVR